MDENGLNFVRRVNFLQKHIRKSGLLRQKTDPPPFPLGAKQKINLPRRKSIQYINTPYVLYDFRYEAGMEKMCWKDMLENPKNLESLPK